MARRGATGLSGILPVDKPAGMTSHDVVSAVRRATGERRIGHAGTLDPMATGLLVLLVGPATRLASLLTAGDKTYDATIAFGAETDTCDAEGEVVREAEVPASVGDEERARGVVEGLVGEHEQVPPAYSAIKLAGRKAYDIARGGGEPEIAPRRIAVRDAELLGVRCEGGQVSWDLRLRVSKGTYIRSIARDLGRHLGTAAHLAALRRVASGPLSLEAAHTLAQVRSAGEAGSLEPLFVDALGALALPVTAVGPALAQTVTHGRPLDCDGSCIAEEDGLVAVAAEGRLLAVYRRAGGRLVPETVLHGGVR